MRNCGVETHGELTLHSNCLHATFLRSLFGGSSNESFIIRSTQLGQGQVSREMAKAPVPWSHIQFIWEAKIHLHASELSQVPPEAT